MNIEEIQKLSLFEQQVIILLEKILKELKAYDE